MAFFLMRCLHKPDQDAARDTERPRHREWVASGGDGLVSVLIGSALCDDDGRSVGNFGILEAANLADARAFAEGDPFHRAGIVDIFELTPLPDTLQADHIERPMSPRIARE